LQKFQIQKLQYEQRYDPLADGSCYYLQHLLNSGHPDRHIQLVGSNIKDIGDLLKKTAGNYAIVQFCNYAVMQLIK